MVRCFIGSFEHGIAADTRPSFDLVVCGMVKLVQKVKMWHESTIESSGCCSSIALTRCFNKMEG